ncbi:MAG: YitT family protein [Eubacteriales bacterium]
MDVLRRYTVITLGCALYAAGFALFLEPAHLAAGGVSGIAVLVTHFWEAVDGGTVIFLLNLPLLLVGSLVFGGRFFFGTVWATVVSSGMISLAEHFMYAPIGDDRYFCAVMGALLTGVGMGMIFRCGATTGGTDIVVRLIQRRVPKIKTGYLFLFVDAAVVLASGVVFGDAATVVYSALSLAANTLVLNLMLYGVTKPARRE